MQLLMKQEEQENKVVELQPQTMVQVQVPAGAVPGTKLSVPTGNGSMVTVELPQGALPNTTLQVPVPTQSYALNVVGDNKNEYKQHKRSYNLFLSATICTYFLAIYYFAMLMVSLNMMNPMSYTLRHRAEDGVNENKTAHRSLYSHEIPPKEMFAGIDLYGPNKTAVLQVYKAHWDAQRDNIRTGHKRFLSENNATKPLTKVCRNARFNLELHYEDTTECKCAPNKDYWICEEETEVKEKKEEEEEKPEDPYICSKRSTFISAACSECAWCKNKGTVNLILIFLRVSAGWAIFNSALLLGKEGLRGLGSIICIIPILIMKMFKLCCGCCCSRNINATKMEKRQLYDVFHLAKLTFFMKGKDRLYYSVVLLLEDAIVARNLFHTLESKREVLKRDIKNEKAW
jgi:hypothetical protein